MHSVDRKVANTRTRTLAVPCDVTVLHLPSGVWQVSEVEISFAAELARQTGTGRNKDLYKMWLRIIRNSVFNL